MEVGAAVVVKRRKEWMEEVGVVGVMIVVGAATGDAVPHPRRNHRSTEQHHWLRGWQ